MNELIYLKGKLGDAPNKRKGFSSNNLPKNEKVSISHLESLRYQLKEILKFWEENPLISGALISVHYSRIISKSNRIKEILVKGKNAISSIKGAKFIKEAGKFKHVFTYFISIISLKNAITRLDECIEFAKKHFTKFIWHSDLDKVRKNYPKSEFGKISANIFINTIVDAFYVEKFAIDSDIKDVKEESIVSIYYTEQDTSKLLQKIGININFTRIIDQTTLLLSVEELNILKEKAPYLIAMHTSDILEITNESIEVFDQNIINIPAPNNEPVIGVIDTLFDKQVYFKDWVEYERMVDENIEVSTEDYFHGTEVSSIIVDGPSINPNLDDGCGRFRVKHFGVAVSGRFSSFSILKSIKKAVMENRNIKVWNLSLGSNLEIGDNFISPEASILDAIQSEYDVIFIVAGTNKPKNKNGTMRLGAPADSINSIVVNSVKKNNLPSSYYRVGPVLSFFNKPDISYYGGDEDEPMRVCTPLGERFVSGTSFAAPWITRKVAYLIYKMGLTREVAKALIIDSAIGWRGEKSYSKEIGYGVVPIHIKKILQTNNDEIKFLITGTVENYEMYTYQIPVPLVNNSFPFYAKATLCFFPKCTRNQGVDYTNTELDLYFGRTKIEKDHPKVQSINGNQQSVEGSFTFEEEARKTYRKWDNVKHISDNISSRAIPRKKFDSASYWGLRVLTKERLSSRHFDSEAFGIVVTLKEMFGENRFSSFVQMCELLKWNVVRINMETQIEIYNKAEEEIEFK